MDLAPIILFCYNRPSNLKSTIESLKKNPLCKKSELFIFKDGLKNNPTKNQQIIDQEIVDYITKIDGFNKVSLTIREKNLGLVKNILDGLSTIFKEYPTAIVLEDDLEFSDDFLEFMNEGLQFYEKDLNVGSISGYSFGYEKLNLKDQLIATNRHSSWGWGTWKDRWKNIDWEIKDFENIRNNKIIQLEFNKAGNDFFNMLKKSYEGRIQSWAIKWNYHNYQFNRFCIVPKSPKVNNTGTDSKGTNFSRKTKKYHVEICSEKIIFKKNLKVEEETINFNQRKFRIGKVERFKNLFNL